MTRILLILLAVFSALFAVTASAAVCTSVSNGNWNQAARWSCGHVPVAADTVVIANTVTINVNNTTIAGLTVNSGATLSRASGTRTFTINGNLQVDGNVNSNAAGGIRFNVSGAGSVISGSGALNNVYVYVAGAAVSVAAGSALNFSGGSQIFSGRRSNGTTVRASVLTINGTINLNVAVGATIFNLYADSTVVGSTGVINGPNGRIRYLNNTSGFSNNGAVTVNYISRNSASNAWTQGVSASLTISRASTLGVFNASASGNTVTFNGTSAVLSAAASTYWNVAGSIFPAACPNLSAYTVLGSSPCPVIQSQTRSPASCASVTGSSGNKSWNSPGNATASDDSRTDSILNGTGANGRTRYLQCLDYQFNIPANATITGIVVNVERRVSNTGTGNARDYRMRVIRSGAIGATNRVTTTVYTASDVVEPHGGSTYLWGATWTPALINAADFGAAFSATRTSGSPTVQVDHMPISVFYTLPAGPDHIQISHSGSALTCSPQYVTITACADAACSTLYTGGGLSVTLAPGGLTYTIGTSGINSAATVQQSTAGLASLGATSSPATINPTTCLNSVNGTTGCTNAMMFNSAGFLITAPDHVSCTNANISIEAVQQGVPANRCVPAYANVTRPVNLSLAYGNPATGTKALRDVNNGSDITTTASSHGLNFDATGTAILTVSYPDAGQVTLTANDIAPTGATLAGNASFIAAPASFAFSGVTAGPIKAGNNFNATITAQTATGAACASPATASNFGKETTPQTAVVSFSKCQPTGTAASNGAFSGSAIFNNGVANVTNLNWSEAGNGDLVATNTGYLGSGLNISGTTGSGGTACGGGTGAVGTFIPDHFDTSVTDGCAGCGFTYSGQPFSVTVTALNGLPLPTVTQNYDGTANTSPNFAHAVSLMDANALATPPGVFGVSGTPMGVTVNGAGSILTVPATDFISGVATLSNVPVYTFSNKLTSPITLRMRATDNFYTPVQVTSSGFTEGNAEIRSGRLRISNAYGSELLPLMMSATVQFYNAAGSWVTNSTDTVTAIAASDFAFDFPLTAANRLAACETALSITGGSPVFTLNLSAPGAGNDGWTDLTLNLDPVATGNRCTSVGAAGTASTTATLPWLQYSVGINPVGRATFGVFSSGKTEIIYQRENY